MREAGPRGISGEVLASRLGVTRVAVAKHVAALRANGYRIAAMRGSGYALVAPSDMPIPAEVSRRLSSKLWVRLEGGGVTGSTNDDCRRLAVAGAPEGTVVLATEQTGGKGRLGRRWVSPEGGVYVSMLLRPRSAVAEVAPLSLVIGLGVARGLEARFGVKIGLKWPNDLILADGKLAGVLLEMSAEGEFVEWIVAGVGVNVRAQEARVEGAAYLADNSDDPAPAAVAAALLDGVAEAYGRFCEGGFGALRAEYLRHETLIGQPATVSSAAGALAHGTVADVDEFGRLVLDVGGALTPIAAGEVTLRTN